MLLNQTLFENPAQGRVEPGDVLVPEGVAGGIERSFLTPHVSHGQAQEFGALGASLLILHCVNEPSCGGGPSPGRNKSDWETRNIAKQTHVQQWETCRSKGGDTESRGCRRDGVAGMCCISSSRTPCFTTTCRRCSALRSASSVSTARVMSVAARGSRPGRASSPP